VKQKVHLRVAKDARGKGHVMATARPSSTPIYNNRNQPLPTVAFAVVLNVPDELFDQAQKVIAEIDVSGDQVQIAAEVKAI
jgi:hypothetical protein